MSTNNISKINRLLQSQPYGVVFLASWLEANGYSRDLQRRYVKSGWLKPFGRGALVREGQQIQWYGMINALQNQTKKDIHAGARSALNLLGMSHYIDVTQKKIEVFTPCGVNLPNWFINNNIDIDFIHYRTNFLPPDDGLTDYESRGINISISSAVRALMECLYLSPYRFDLIEAYQIMEGLTAAHPEEVQRLLSVCNSVKVVRLFLYLAEKADHSWVKKLNLKEINLGMGKRTIGTNGVLIRKYNIIVPVDLTKA